jgi:thiamine transport system substrate-binding protein
MDVRHRSLTRLLAALGVLALLAAGCSDDLGPEAGSTCFDDPGVDPLESPAGQIDATSITLATHDSFVLPARVFEDFTDQTGISVQQVAVGDAGALVSQAILTRDNPTADVLFGIDNTFLCRGLEAGVFLPYRAPGLEGVGDDLELDPFHRVTPIDFGDVCVNYWIDAVPGPVPTTLDDLIDPANAGQFVTPNPETSSPGFAFLLATIATYGAEWERYWQDLVANDVAITAGWNDAYYGDFIAGGGARSMVTSYATSPPAEVIFADPAVDAPPTGVLADSCFRQIEFAGILAGTEHPEAAAALVDFMLSPSYQAAVPLNMFVYPAVAATPLPPEFVAFGQVIDEALILDPVDIEMNRDEWTARWTDVVLG